MISLALSVDVGKAVMWQSSDRTRSADGSFPPVVETVRGLLHHPLRRFAFAYDVGNGFLPRLAAQQCVQIVIGVEIFAERR
jgi:hypothetical protein